MNEQMMSNIATGSVFLRKIVIYFLKKFSFDMKIKNPYSGTKFLINTYRHKGYWYFGDKREEKTTKSIKSLINKGDKIVEVGGHIGFLSHLYSDLVGPEGHVYVFEPGVNNVPYTRFNVATLSNITLYEKGCSDYNGPATFYNDGLTGQNNSLLDDFEGVEEVAASHYENSTRTPTIIEVIKLSHVIDELNFIPNHIKIDVEGAEINVLKGIGNYLGIIPSLMVEVTRNEKEVFSLMQKFGYIAFDENLVRLEGNFLRRGNTFFLLPK